MIEVVIYVEGRSDKLGLEVLLERLLTQIQQQGVSVKIFEARDGDRKASLLNKMPLAAVDILRNKPDAFVIVMPDLYPKNKVFPHETFAEMRDGIQRNFEQALHQKGITDGRLRQRFKVFCFKYDLEALLLASKDALEARLNVRQIADSWVIPVEDQNHDNPPKRIVESIFQQHGKRYKDTIDVPLILSHVDYVELAEQCPQAFKPFVDFLTQLSGD